MGSTSLRAGARRNGHPMEKETLLGQASPPGVPICRNSHLSVYPHVYCITTTDIRICKGYTATRSAVDRKAIVPATTWACWSPVNCGNIGSETISEAVLSATGKSPA